jgi:serine/threonine-protein kinase
VRVFAGAVPYVREVEGAPGPRKLPEGTMLDDKYRVERLLAVGGMGAVYAGTHVKLRKRVAIKVLNPQLATPPMIERFHREAITASQIGHEGIAQVTDLGTSADGEPFLVMEYLEGESLASRLRAAGPLAIEGACELGCAILSPLAAAHRAGIIHRDLKPDNVFLVRQSRGEMVKLLDFGISRASGIESEFRLTTTGLVLGTPYYMSPEQARGDAAITPAADLYAFGVMLYEMLVGSVPIQADNYNQLMYRVMIGDFAPPRSRRADLPEALEAVILQAMALEPQARPASALDLEQALLAFCSAAFRDHLGGRLSSPGLLLPSAPSGSGQLRLTPSGHAFAGPGSGPRAPAPDPHGPGAGQPPGHAHGPGAGQPTNAPGLASAATVPDAPRRAPRSPRWPLVLGAAVVAGGIAAAVIASQSTGSAGADHPASAKPTTDPVAALASAQAASAGPEATAPASTQAAPPASDPKRTAEAAGSDAERTAEAAGSTHARTDQAAGSDAGRADQAAGGAAGRADEAAAEKAAGPATVTLRFAVEPAGAAITLDGKPVRGAELAVPRDAARHALRITAPGYLAHDETVQLDESQRLVVQLKRAEPARPTRPRKDRADRIDSQSPYD